MVRILTTRPGRILARFAVLVVAGYLSHVAEYVLAPRDRMILGVEGLDARPLFYIATVVGVLYAIEPHADLLRWAWLLMLSVTAWGRAVSLLVLGSPEIDRATEIAGFISWAIAWLAGVLAAFILTAGKLLSTDRR